MFKAGDKVRYNNPRFDTCEATVIRIESDGSVVVDTHGDFKICTEDPKDIRLVNDGPVREVTPKQIVPGTYGKVRVTAGGHVHCTSMKTAEDIRATIATLEQIVEAM